MRAEERHAKRWRGPNSAVTLIHGDLNPLRIDILSARTSASC